MHAKNQFSKVERIHFERTVVVVIAVVVAAAADGGDLSSQPLPLKRQGILRPEVAAVADLSLKGAVKRKQIRLLSVDRIVELKRKVDSFAHIASKKEKKRKK